VLLTHPSTIRTPQIEDHRIAVCFPSDASYRQRDRLGDEIATIRQTQELYLTQRDPEADLIRRTLEQRREGLEDEITTQEVARYSTSTVLAGPGPANSQFQRPLCHRVPRPASRTKPVSDHLPPGF